MNFTPRTPATRFGSARPWRRVAAAIAAVLALPSLARAASLSLSPASAAADYDGAVTVTISGLTAGQAVRVEAFLDRTRNNQIDLNDPLVLSFRVADGVAASIGGVRNTNVPGDEDGAANGQIRTLLQFPRLPETNRAVANYVYRVSPVDTGFTPATKPFSVTQASFTQKITGTVKQGGVAVPYAFVFVLPPDYGGPVVMAMTGNDGTFTLNTPAGTYLACAAAPGYVFDLNVAPEVTVSAGQTITQDLSLTQADRTISGRLKEAESGSGIPGAQVLGNSGDGGRLALTHTNANGDYSIQVASSSAEWGVDPSGKYAAFLGRMRNLDAHWVDVSGGPVSGANIEWQKATALVYGVLKDDQQAKLARVNFYADGDWDEAVGLSDAEGNYVLGVAAGTWWVGPDADELNGRGYLGDEAELAIADGEALRQDFVVEEFTAYFRGRVIDDGGAPVAYARIAAALDTGEGWHEVWTDADGNFEIGVTGGAWVLQLDSYDAYDLGLVTPILAYDVTDGIDIDDVEYVAPAATAYVTGRVRDNTNAPVVGVWVSTYSVVGGTEYAMWFETDSQGAFDIPVFDGSWQVGVNCFDLQWLGYECVDGQNVTISGADRIVNFNVRPITVSTPTATPTTSPTASPSPSPTPLDCVGDCNADAHLSVDEILRGIRIALGLAGTQDCEPFDRNADQRVTIDELVRGVRAALLGCAA